MTALRNSMKINLRTVLFLAVVSLIASNSCLLAHTDVTPEQAKDLIDSTNDLIVVDVREPFEYCDVVGHIPWALNYPLTSGVLDARYEELPVDAPILVVCRSGGRSNAAANFLDSVGYSMVYDMMGGMNAWIWETEPCKTGDNGTVSAQTNTYVFLADQSTLLQTGGIAGFNINYSVEGHFQLTVDKDAGTGSFTLVDANAIDNSPLRRTLDPNQVFNMNSLRGIVLNETTISFIGIASDGSDIRITVTIEDDLAYLVGETVPPPNTADFFMFSLDAVAQRKYGGGTGEPNDPYQIATAQDLILLGDSPEDYDKHFILTADIDLDPNLPGRKIFDKAVIAPDTKGSGFFDGTPFTGVFDGNGHIISHLTIVGGRYLGLIGYLGSAAIISNLGLEAVDVSGSGYYIGGLVGVCSSGDRGVGSIITSYSMGTVTGSSLVGGLVGWNEGSITTSYSMGAVSGDIDVGGLVGKNFKGSIANSYSTSTIKGHIFTHGLIGRNIGGSITSSFWDMETSGRPTSAGGTGLSTAEMQNIDTYLNAGWDFVDEILNGTCDYWQITPGDYPRLRYHFIHSPVMPDGLGTAEQPYLIRDARDLGTVCFKPVAHYRMEASVDLSGIVWSMAVIPWFEGTFDANDHVISNLHIRGGGYLGLFGQLGSGANISNLGLEAVDVNGTGSNVGGLVGWNEGSITMSYCMGAVTGSSHVGGLVGENFDGSIATSYSIGTVTGDWNIGGLVGWNFRGSIITSYSAGSMKGNGEVGGLVGDNLFGSVSNSYSTGTVTGDSWVGGLVGTNWGSIATSYSTGKVSGAEDAGGLVGNNRWGYRIISCFWDMDTSGLTNMCGEKGDDAAGCNDSFGKTIAEMQTATTFLDFGWDFVDETENGTEDIWWILEGQDYPRLFWEIIPEN